MGRGSRGGRGRGGNAFKRRRMDDEPRDERREFEEPHEGSFKLEEVKAMDWYAQRIDQGDVPKRKYALCIGYCGTDYQGSQINPGAITIESMVERALLLSGGIAECNFGNLQKISWTRSARTDKGVHAASQCFSMKLAIKDEAKYLEQLNTFLPPDIRVLAVTRTTKSFNAKCYCTHRNYHYLLPTYVLQPHTLPHQDIVSNRLTYRIDATTLSTLRSTLQVYLGTHNYHNFTQNKDSSDANSLRHMLYFEAGDPFLQNGVEYICLTVKGQSFLLNQIRKMVAVAIDVVRGAMSAGAMEKCFSDMKVDLPMVPGVGLYLNELFFDTYTSKLKYEEKKATAHKQEAESGDAEDTSCASAKPLEWTSDPEVNGRMKNFRENVIWPHIFEEEAKTLPFDQYLAFHREIDFTSRYPSAE